MCGSIADASVLLHWSTCPFRFCLGHNGVTVSFEIRQCVFSKFDHPFFEVFFVFYRSFTFLYTFQNQLILKAGYLDWICGSSLWGLASLIVLILSSHEHDMSFHLWKSYLIYLCSVLQTSASESCTFKKKLFLNMFINIWYCFFKISFNHFLLLLYQLNCVHSL